MKIMERATAKSTFKVGQAVLGNYCGKTFTGVLNNNTRASVDGRNIIFGITLEETIVVYGQERSTIEIDTTESSNELYLFGGTDNKTLEFKVVINGETFEYSYFYIYPHLDEVSYGYKLCFCDEADDVVKQLSFPDKDSAEQFVEDNIAPEQ